MKIASYFLPVYLAGAVLGAQELSQKYEGVEDLVAQTHQRSLEARKQDCLKTLSRKPWPGGAWGDTLWSLASLYQNEKTDEANAILLRNARAFAGVSAGEADFLPERFPEKSPWAYFALPDYVRILCLFRKGSPHLPGRLNPETEAAMKEALWIWIQDKSRVEEALLENLPVLHGTENHDLTLRPSYYLIASVLKDDPAYAGRLFGDGKNAAQHYAAYNLFFQKWAEWRVRYGLWAEIGSDVYQKYSYPALFNLADLAPDPVVRKQFKMLLDIALIEEAQISVKGRRGGGRSRASYGENSFEAYKNLLYAPEGRPASTSHSSVIETSRYQAPAAAIVLRNLEFPPRAPFIIQNRVLGEIGKSGESSLAADSALVNYAWRTPHLILGSTQQNPALATAAGTHGYMGISRQKRWCGVIFEDDGFSAIYPELEKLPGGRPQHPYWSFQHENVLLIQRITPDRKKLGSYNTGWIGIRMAGEGLRKVERKGWIFVEKSMGYVAVRFLDSDYRWDENGGLVIPQDHNKATSGARILMISGGAGSDGDFQKFQDAVMATPLEVTPERVSVRAGGRNRGIQVYPYDARNAATFKFPKVDGEPCNFRPPRTFESPYLKSAFGSARILVEVGPVKQVYDFEHSRID